MCCFRLLHETISLQFEYKDSAKHRFSEEKENELSFLSVRFLFKSKTMQNKSPKTFIFTQLSQKREVKEVKEVKEEVSLSEAKKRRM